jgi:hypothetical protein
VTLQRQEVNMQLAIHPASPDVALQPWCCAACDTAL